MSRVKTIGLAAVTLLLAATASASATPVCTDGYAGGPPAAVCDGRIFPEAALARGYVQYTEDPTGFSEYRDGIAYLAQKYPRWVSVFKLSDRYGEDAVSAGPDEVRSYDAEDAADGRDVWVIKLSDHNVPDAGKRHLFFSLSVHGNERGGLEGGLRTVEDLAMAATDGGEVIDGVDNYTSTTGRAPTFHSYEARDLLAQEAVYFIDFNVDGWAIGDFFASPATQPYARGNSIGTDLNRQMPTIGRIDTSRNPLQESEMRFGTKLMEEVAAAGRNGLLDYGADIHGELTSQAYTDVMYPAGQFDSVAHRRLMAIAERTKSVIDATLYEGIVDQIEAADGGDEAEGSSSDIPTKPAHWATVWDTLGYTDTGFIGDYLAADLGVTGMDYEIFLNHTVPDKTWNVYLQENHINASRAIIKTAMAYALTQQDEFSKDNVALDAKGRPGYVLNPEHVTDTDANGIGTLPGPDKDGKGRDGQPVRQRPYDATNQRWFADSNRLMPKPFYALNSADVAASGDALDYVDTLVLADEALPKDARGRSVDRAAYFANLGAWVRRGGNLVLTDRALHALGDLGVVPADKVKDVKVYQPYANFADLEHTMARGLRPNARQLVEAAILGYEIGNDASPMTIVETAAWETAGGKVVATTGNNSGSSDDGTQTSIGEVKLGSGFVRIVGGALPSPTEINDHRYGLRDYSMTYTGLYVMENSIQHDAPGLGEKPLPVELQPPPSALPTPSTKGRCRRGARVTLRVPRKARGRIRVRVNGKRAKVRRVRGGRVVRIPLRKLAGRKVTVRFQRRAGAKWKTVAVKRFRVCAKAR